ncbi:zinc metallochaperone AztD [Leucobacter albus]|uniref:Zinc metallochaperone AztD n=1 Tax=Leucobacter albus TaxID=272210 RepID=A0ABW3TI41_9MICO
MHHHNRPHGSLPARPSRLLAAAAAALGIAVLAGCSASAAPEETGSGGAPGASTSAAGSNTRLAVTTPGGITVLDSDVAGGSLSVAGSVDTEAFTRLNAFGDGKHLLVTTSQGFEVLDTETAAFTGQTFPATAAGHVVRHGDATVLFDDGTGRTTILDRDGLLGDASSSTPRHHDAADPHHGVSIVLADGTLLTTVGNADARSGAVALEPHDDHWHDLAQSDECPSIHGEGTAANEAVVFGCENGALLYSDGAFTKLNAPDAYGRMGNAYTSEHSPLVVGDYKNDPDAEGYLLSQVALIDTAAKTLAVHELPERVRYTYRDVVRGPEGHAYILSTDGSIHVLDAKTGEIVDEFAVVAPWEGPANWQDAHPTIVADGDIAYVTEPAARAVHTVDLASGKVIASVTLDAAPNEIAVALG